MHEGVKDVMHPKDEYLSKSGYFSAIGLSRVKTVADRYRHPAYRKKHR